MRAFEVALNGKRLCTAGVGDDGVLSVIMDHLIGQGHDSVALNVGGLLSKTNEHVVWRHKALKSGDEVHIKVIDAESVDKPRKRGPRNVS